MFYMKAMRHLCPPFIKWFQIQTLIWIPTVHTQTGTIKHVDSGLDFSILTGFGFLKSKYIQIHVYPGEYGVKGSSRPPQKADSGELVALIR